MVPWTLVADFAPAKVARDDQSSLLLSLRSLRGNRFLEEVASQAGIRADELSRIERGLTKQIRWETLLRIMRTYQCSPDEILSVKEETANSGDGTPRGSHVSCHASRGRPERACSPFAS
jgi:DNA-binding Xre family transcriptional regulator